MVPNKKFSFVIPATIEKAENGEWRVYGKASSKKRDLQGEVVDQKGLDLSPIMKGKGFFNWDHKKGPENTVGVIDTWKKTEDELYLGGYLFQGHDKAKAIHQIMDSFKKSDRGRMGMSVEGVIKERAGDDGKIVKKALITNCAITFNPVNTESYVDLVKSLNAIEFETDALREEIITDADETAVETKAEIVEKSEEKVFTASQVVSLLYKTLTVGYPAATTLPADRTGGDVLAQEELDSDVACPKCKGKGPGCKCPKKRKNLKKATSIDFKKSILDILEQLQILYPDASRSELWETVKDRLNTRFLEDV